MISLPHGQADQAQSTPIPGFPSAQQGWCRAAVCSNAAAHHVQRSTFPPFHFLHSSAEHPSQSLLVSSAPYFLLPTAQRNPSHPKPPSSQMSALKPPTTRLLRSLPGATSSSLCWKISGINEQTDMMNKTELNECWPILT